MKNLKVELVKAEDNYKNAFLAEEDQIGEQFQASMTLKDGVTVYGEGATEDKAIEELRERIKDHYNVLAHMENLEVNKAIGLKFFD